MLNMFLAWSAREKHMTLLSSRNDGMRFEVQPKGWDVVSMYRIMRVAGTGVKQKMRVRATPLINLREMINKFNRKNKDNIIDNVNDDYSISIGDWTDMYLTENVPPSPSPSPFTIFPTTPLLSVFPSSKTAPPISPPTRLSSRPRPRPESDNNAVYWSPLGLLDMLNTGGHTDYKMNLRIVIDM